MTLRLPFLMFVSLAIVGCARRDPPPSPPPEVLVVPVVQRDVPVFGEWIGTLDGSVNADIRPKVEGYLMRQFYKEGQFVEAKDPLFEIDPRQFRAAHEEAHGALARAEAQLSRASRDVERFRPLASQRAISQQELDNALSSEREAKAAVESAQAAVLGRRPQPIPRESPAAALPPAIPAGLPATLLERRPDLREAEQQLVAANAGIGAAKAAFFPTLSLTGLFGNVSPELGDLFSSGKTWSLAANVLGPIFTGGSLKRSYEVTKAQREQAKIRYEAAVTNALAEVSTALVSRAKLVETERQRARAVAAYREAVRLANLRYVSGLSAYFEVLESQQQLFPAEITLAQTRRNQLIAVVDLYRALGGGWKAEGLMTEAR